MLLTVDGGDSSIKFLSQHKFEAQFEDSLMYDMGIIARKGTHTKVYAFEKSGERKLVIFAIIGSRLVEVDTFENFHKD